MSCDIMYLVHRVTYQRRPIESNGFLLPQVQSYVIVPVPTEFSCDLYSVFWRTVVAYVRTENKSPTNVNIRLLFDFIF